MGLLPETEVPWGGAGDPAGPTGPMGLRDPQPSSSEDCHLHPGALGKPDSGGKETNFLPDFGAPSLYSSQTLGKSFSEAVVITDMSGKPTKKYFSQPLGWSWGELPLSHAFLILQKASHPLQRQYPLNPEA